MKGRLNVATLLAGAGLLAMTAQLAKAGEVTVWSWFISSTMQKSIAALEKAHPDIKVTYTYYNYWPEYLTALKAGAASDNLPDVIGLQPGAFTEHYREKLNAVNDLGKRDLGRRLGGQDLPCQSQADVDGQSRRRQWLLHRPAGDRRYCASGTIARSLRSLASRFRRPMTRWSRRRTSLTEGGYMPMFQGAADGWQNINVFLMLANQLAPGLVEKAQAGEASWSAPELEAAMTAWATCSRTASSSRVPWVRTPIRPVRSSLPRARSA